MNSLLIGLTLFGSLSMRTPNDINFQDTPDYEVSIGVKNKNIFLNRQWERQDGLSYVDDEYWFKTEPGDFYFKPQYVNKASRDLKYTKLDLRYKPDYFKGLSVGYTGFDYGDTTKNSISVGYFLLMMCRYLQDRLKSNSSLMPKVFLPMIKLLT